MNSKNVRDTIVFSSLMIPSICISGLIGISGLVGYRVGGIVDRLTNKVLYNSVNEKSVENIDDKVTATIKNREMNKRNLEEASKILPAEIPSEDSRLETIRNQYKKLKQQYEDLGQGLNELEKSLYQQ